MFSLIYVVIGIFIFPLFIFPSYGLIDYNIFVTFLIIASVISAIGLMLVFKHPTRSHFIIGVFMIATVLSISVAPLMVSFVPWIEDAYKNELRGYEAVLGYCFANTSPQCLFEAVKEYTNRFIGTYKYPYPKPRQFLIDALNAEFVKKLAVILKTGACEDYSLGLTKLIEDIYGLKTRVVVFDEWDHAMPEAEINGTWYVLDLVFTTPNNIVKASDYAEHLSKICRELGGNYCELYEKLVKREAKIMDGSSREDLAKEHGFS